MTSAATVIGGALSARTLEDAITVHRSIVASGAPHQRPLGDRWSNLGLITRPGSADHKLIDWVEWPFFGEPNEIPKQGRKITGSDIDPQGRKHLKEPAAWKLPEPLTSEITVELDHSS